MRETTRFTDQQRAVVLAVIKQFEDNLAKPHFRYDPVSAQRELIKTGKAEELEIDIHKQHDILKELSNMDLGIDIIFLKNTLSPDGNFLVDNLRGTAFPPDDPADIDNDERYNFCLCYGSIYVDADLKAIKRLRALCVFYIAKFNLIDDGIGYSITVYNEDNAKVKTLHYPKLHPKSRTQVIIQYLISKKGKTVEKSTLNNILTANKAKLIKDKESIASSIWSHSDPLKAILPYFFKFKAGKAKFLGNINRNLTQLDVDRMEQHCEK